MRLDSLGKPPLVQAEKSDTAQVRKKEESLVVPVTASPGLEASLSQNQGGKLGQILNIMQKAKDRKKKPVMKNEVLEALKIYQRQMNYDENETQTGQILDLKG